jgi:hypothetical protein
MLWARRHHEHACPFAWLCTAAAVRLLPPLRRRLLLPCPPAGLQAALRSRRVQAGAKYWAVLMLMLVGILVLQYLHPRSIAMGPSFGYTAAAVGMSDRVEATVFKVRRA